MGTTVEKAESQLDNAAPDQAAVEVADPMTPEEVKPLGDQAVKPLLTKKVSALSLSSIRSKKELEASLQKKVINLEDLPKDHFTMDQMMEHWNYYAHRLNQSGLMLMCSLMGMCQPKLEGVSVSIELPNEGSKLSFDENKYDLVNFLRKKLNNYDLEIHITVNEQITIKRAFTPEDKYKHLNQINPSLEMLVRTFELDITKM